MSPFDSKRSKETLATAKQAGKHLHLLSYKITYEPLLDKKERIPKRLQSELTELYDLLHANPQAAIPRLLQLKDQYPKVPVLYNFLTAAYNRIGDQSASRKLAEENYRNNPEYLFARINHAQFCLLDGDLDQIPEIFDEKYDLKLLYPKRNQFHVTEYAGFTGVMCAYFSMIDQKETAKLLYESLLKVAPESEMVRFAQSFVYPSWLDKLRRWAQNTTRKANQATATQENPHHDGSDFTA